jgi:SAM-dependent methyltransferase
MDDDLAKLRFVAARRNQMGNGHLHTVCGSPSSNLPLSSESYDAVILLDAFEQASSNGRDWRTAQQAMLSEVMRVLRTGGWLLLGAVNRLGLARSRDELLTHPRTFWGYRRALRMAGFQAIEFHTPLPSYKEPFFILPLDQARPLDLFIDQIFTAQDYRAKLEERGLGAAYRLAQAAWRTGRRLRISQLARYVVPSYLVLAQK